MADRVETEDERVAGEPGLGVKVSGQQVKQQSFKTSGCSAQQVGVGGATRAAPAGVSSWQQSVSIPSLAASMVQHSASVTAYPLTAKGECGLEQHSRDSIEICEWDPQHELGSTVAQQKLSISWLM